MALDWKTCSQARLSRDVRFDGKFYIAVLTSGVYCRPICPARTAKEDNVRYFETAVGAEEAGFRPCLRCRPECSPGTPAWCGTSNTVSRALRLIEESGLENGGVEVLAERLGIGSRHLRRLFLIHLGATPNSVAQTRRMQFAKKLVDETRLPFSEVAFASGFGSVRRFNAAMRKMYSRTPRQIRNLARHNSAKAEDNQYVFRLRFRPPYQWDILLNFLRARAMPGVEGVTGNSYRRTFALQGHSGWFEISPDQSGAALLARIQCGNPQLLFAIVERIRSMFDLNADWTLIARCLGTDPALRQSIRRAPGLRVPGCWDGFELAVRAILGQQVTVRGATTIAGRLVRAFGTEISCTTGLTHLFPEPGRLSDAKLESIGLTAARAETIRALARDVRKGDIRFHGVIDTTAFLDKLCQIPGIGNWTAQYVAMRALREPDAFPTGDLGLLHSLGSASHRELSQRSEPWRPWRAYAAMYLWCVPEKSMRELKNQPFAAQRSAQPEQRI
ncbi:MAG TPA: AlkA N-terminal domain-containing protein [Terriglobales bacterium]|jgi:AraC family transcriptional regulator, regulatory protein of adaptative response / DNA-3-methyladenine glycosylase II|nr:AlkA N-terminal domain-containing protein [Terriglobales bacterium]